MQFATSARVLIVDDEVANVQVLSRILTRAGLRNMHGTTDSRLTLQLLEEFKPDLILLDLHMPGMDGFAVLEQLREAIPVGTYLPILTLTGDDSAETRLKALSMGARDFLTKPFDVTEVLLRIRNLLETRALHLALHDQNQSLEQRVQMRTREVEKTQLEVLERLAAAAEFRDDDTGQHTHRVASVATAIAAALSEPEGLLELLRRAAPLHDVGKIGVPDGILLKPGTLTPDETVVMRRHTVIGASLLAGGASDMMRMAERIALSHHERWDGTGYPNQLAGETIPFEARIVAVADFFDALTHDRPYRRARAADEVRAEIGRLSGRHFDPRIATAFLGLDAPEQICDPV